MNVKFRCQVPAIVTGVAMSEARVLNVKDYRELHIPEAEAQPGQECEDAGRNFTLAGRDSSRYISRRDIYLECWLKLTELAGRIGRGVKDLKQTALNVKKLCSPSENWSDSRNLRQAGGPDKSDPAL